ncbi:hypothetical protein [Micromonospora eburnea]|uniref:Uncharacterized protein n=1 Tax=Micromonospora eburnea TaxID=227316 RepID=A0A1C6UZ42_9ACTN|nr:hypothetical protein [Micromonospora eburnea]SCL59227.1 hypothetical protein GA0070604_4008 [Micromonospora eburnea]
MKTLVPAPPDSSDPFDLDLRTLRVGATQAVDLAPTSHLEDREFRVIGQADPPGWVSMRDCQSWSCVGSTCGYTCGGRTGQPCAC